MRTRAMVSALVLPFIGATTACGGTSCPEGWEAAELQCEPTADTTSTYAARVGTGFFGYAAYGEKISDDGEPCAWEPTELAPGEGFDVRVINEAGDAIETVRAHVQEDGAWELTVVPGRTYDLLVESTLEGKPVLVEEGKVQHVAVFFDTGCD